MNYLADGGRAKIRNTWHKFVIYFYKCQVFMPDVGTPKSERGQVIRHKRIIRIIEGTNVKWLMQTFERKGEREEILSFIVATLEA